MTQAAPRPLWILEVMVLTSWTSDEAPSSSSSCHVGWSALWVNLVMRFATLSSKGSMLWNVIGCWALNVSIRSSVALGYTHKLVAALLVTSSSSLRCCAVDRAWCIQSRWGVLGYVADVTDVVVLSVDCGDMHRDGGAVNEGDTQSVWFVVVVFVSVVVVRLTLMLITIKNPTYLYLMAFFWWESCLGAWKKKRLEINRSYRKSSKKVPTTFRRLLLGQWYKGVAHCWNQPKKQCKNWAWLLLVEVLIFALTCCFFWVCFFWCVVHFFFRWWVSTRA